MFLFPPASRQALPAAGVSRPVVTVTTTMIGSMVDLLAGKRAELQVLVPPGACPGHFDLRPEDALRLSRAGVVIRHDFQSYLDRKLISQNPAMKIAVLESAGSLVVPDNFLKALAEVKHILRQNFPGVDLGLEKNFAAAGGRVEQARQEALNRLAHSGIKGSRVLASFMQADFARWAGLEVVDEFTNSPDALSALRLKELVETARKNHISFIAGNLHGGGAVVARLLSTETGLPVCLLSNFPGTNERNTTYFDLLLDNVNLLIETGKKALKP